MHYGNASNGTSDGEVATARAAKNLILL